MLERTAIADRPAAIVSRVETAAPRRRASGAEGARVTLTDGREYLDLMNGKGCVTLGHNHPVVNEAVVNHLRSAAGCATCWGDAHEALAARILGDLAMPGWRLAFFSTGTEACRAAVQAARAFTHRPLIASAGYHGWGSEWDASATLLQPNARGVVDFYFVPALLEELLVRDADRIAAVILSPDYVHLRPDTLAELVSLARRHGVLVCCDDVKQGYRSTPASPLPSVAGVKADLYTFAKGLANGHRLSCVAGRPDVLAGIAHLTYTAYLDTVPLAAALATLAFMDEQDGYRRLAACGAALARELREVVAASRLPIAIYGDGPLLQFVAADETLDAAMYVAAADAGLLLYEGDNQAVSLATEEVVSEVVDRFATALATLAPVAAAASREPPPIGARRRFEAAFTMMDGATDAVPAADAIRWLPEVR
ncbi:aminotransferase class III-fold pyridoxal phosphate-dependent enzyme [Sphingomonas zeae]